ncbi:site-specific DNA-methyltransferase [Pseudomonas sp. FG1]|uniref:site-specific DNA-methyltransferase n=1 Tax=Pseudomonas sp. FG1 TaxID=3048624 RepID=UPI002AB5769A|nr:site-specific DNA-methyltransferase [Pseudomonas sp. FG1]MDY7549465.1 site-specific DNA-methyltransferase [Pseudomonas sp. FG1]MEB0052092.1 site-specific DNA-methyltransferase [Pseudomonas sp. FG1]
MAGKTKLELTWIGKDERPRLEPRILIEEPECSYHAETRREGDHFDNMLIHGDNLLALKALETDPNVRGKVKCIFIDPPYNTGSAFEHYDDGIEHSLWLTMMRDRLTILWELLSEDGSIWITVDDNEGHYLKVICDEIFGRKNFVATSVWQSRYSRSNDALISMSHNFVYCYAVNPVLWKTVRNRLSRTAEQAAQYKNLDNDPLGPWRAIPWDAPNIRENLSYPIITPSGRERRPPQGRCWSRTEGQWLEMVASGRAYFGKSGDGAPSFKQYLSEASGIVPNTWWPHEEVGHTDEAKKEVQTLFGKESAFDTPKPERLMMRIIEIASNPGDLVLDSFAGSGTAGAVAHKMGRRWIMVELGEHAKTHIVPRMQKVIDGTDKGGVTAAVNWQGGGGYRFFQLAPSLLQKDKWGNLVINKDYQPEMLAEAICKHFNYTYAPSTEHYWMHGKATENAFIYVTTNSLTFDQLKTLSDEAGEERSLLVCCMAYETAGDSLMNLTIRKIPRVVLDRCEWGKDDYSLKIAALPLQDAELDAVEITAAKPKKNKSPVAQANLFDGTEEN